MKQKMKIILAIVCSFAIILTSFIGSKDLLKIDEKSSTNANFVGQVSAFLNRYDSDKNYDEITGRYELCRLIVDDYDNSINEYGAIDKAFTVSTTAFLQYKNERDTINAYNNLLKDGYKVLPDSVLHNVIEQSSETGEICPWASQSVGTTDFISKTTVSPNDVKVAVIDNGTMYDHEDFSNRVLSGYDCSEDALDDAYYDTNCEYSVYYHGTMTTGVIINNTPSNVIVEPYKVCPFGSGSSTGTAMITAIDAAVENGCSVINMSISGTSVLYKSHLKAAYDKGIAICAASGNQASSIGDYSIASYEETITIGSTNSSGSVASFSNYGESLDFVAPGVNITSTAIETDGTCTHFTKSGTSYSTPYVSAICALFKGVCPSISVPCIKEILKQNATDIGDSGFDIYSGYGIVNINNCTYSGSIGESSSYSANLYNLSLDILGSGAINDFQSKESVPWFSLGSSLINVNISNEINSIGDFAFYGVTSDLTSLSQSLVDIGNYAFYGCSNLKSALCSIDISAIGTKAFEDCNENFVLTGYQNTPAETYALKYSISFNSLGCKHDYVMDIVDPTETENGYTVYTCECCGNSYIGDYIEPQIISTGECGNGVKYAVYDTGRLNIFGSGDMYDYIDEDVPWIDYIPMIRKIVVESDVKDVSSIALNSLSMAVSFTATENDNYSSQNGILYNKDKTLIISYPINMQGTSYEIPATVKDVSPCAFANVIRLSSITLNSENTDLTIENGLLFNSDKSNIILALADFCDSEITIDSTVTKISSFAFVNSTLKKAIVNNTNVEFGDYSVGYNFNLKVSKVDGFIFEGYKFSTAYDYGFNEFDFVLYNVGMCSNSLTWEFDINSGILYILGYGEMDSYTAGSMPWAQYQNSITSVVIGNGVESICDSAFRGCTALKTVDFGSTLKSIGNNAFSSCSNLESIMLPESVENVGNYAFYICPKVTSVTINNNETVIGQRAFGYYKISILYTVYSGFTVYGFDNSTANTYANTSSLISFSSLGKFSPSICSATGKVVNTRGEAMCGADVVVDGNIVASTDESGSFTLLNLTKGTYLATVKKDDYVSANVTIIISSFDVNAKENIVLFEGDINDDGFVNSRDLKQFSSFVNLGLYEKEYDYNLDGIVDEADALYLSNTLSLSSKTNSYEISKY